MWTDSKTEYRIEKYCVLTSVDNTSERRYYCGGVLLNANGEIIDVWDNNVKFPSKYTDSFIPFANPFERGDIVRDCRNGKIGVIEASQKEWNDFLERNKNNKAYDFWMLL